VARKVYGPKGDEVGSYITRLPSIVSVLESTTLWWHGM